jgi:hypothetical protein
MINQYYIHLEIPFSVLKGAFKLGEKAIATDYHYACYYAIYVIKTSFELGEPAIAKDALHSLRYTDIILKKDFYLDGKLIYKYKG